MLKKCSDCQVEKPLDDFHKNSNRPPHNRAGRCKPCAAVYSANWYQANKDRLIPRMRKTAYARRYKFTVEEYEILLAEQGNGCAICKAITGSNGKRLSVDHNHQTGVVRGLLCDDCNIGLGKFKDNPSLLAKAINYLS